MVCSFSLRSEECVHSYQAYGAIHIEMAWSENQVHIFSASSSIPVGGGLGFLLLQLRIFMGLCDRIAFLISKIIRSDGKIRMMYLWEGDSFRFVLRRVELIDGAFSALLRFRLLVSSSGGGVGDGDRDGLALWWS